MIPLPYIAGAWALSLALAAGGAWIKATSVATGTCNAKALQAQVDGLQAELRTAATSLAIARSHRTRVDGTVQIVIESSRTTLARIDHALAAVPDAAGCDLADGVHGALTDQVRAARDRLRRPADGDAG